MLSVADLDFPHVFPDLAAARYMSGEFPIYLSRAGAKRPGFREGAQRGRMQDGKGELRGIEAERTHSGRPRGRAIRLCPYRPGRN